eukprot:2620135-Lingulodinium_polyedra.AAC.1
MASSARNCKACASPELAAVSTANLPSPVAWSAAAMASVPSGCTWKRCPNAATDRPYAHTSA